MKTTINYRFIVPLMVSVLFLSTSIQNIYSQEPKKNTVRLKADYVKTMNKEVAFNLRASSKVDGSNIDVPDIELTVFNEYNDEKVKLGSTITDSNGKGTFVVNDLSLIKPDSTGLYNISVSFKGNDAFKRASKSLSYKDASIEARIITEDSIHYITATLKDAATDSVLPDQYLNVQVERLFKSLRIGEEFNTTDKTIALQIVSGREGISLRKAACLVYYNIDFSATSYWQSRDRMTTKDRLESDVYWIFSRGGIEKDIYKAVTKKKDYTLRHFKRDLLSL
jgi:hypothetical protein